MVNPTWHFEGAEPDFLEGAEPDFLEAAEPDFLEAGGSVSMKRGMGNQEVKR